jgi:hypothetical protein
MHVSRRQFVVSAPMVLAGASVVSACAQGAEAQDYQTLVAQTWRVGPLPGLVDAAVGLQLVRCATLAPSSHNTQCWYFKVEEGAITILADLSRRCPAVDPDDHHLFVSLGCATENLVQAALAHGLNANASFDASQGAIRVRGCDSN